jgi:hypothetical protein
MAYEDTSVKLYRHNKDNFSSHFVDFSVAGAYIEFLDYVLVDGYAVLSVYEITVSSGTATMNIIGHGLSRYNDHATDALDPQIGPILTVAGATPSELNGTHRCIIVDANTLTFATTAADGTATGTITARVPSLGWEKVYHDPVTHQAVYRSTDPNTSGIMLHVTDDHAFTGWNTGAAVWVRIQGCESATDANNPVDVFGGAYIPKRYSTYDHHWEITGNSVFFRLHCTHSDTSNYTFGSRYTFMTAYGDFDSNTLGDSYNFLIHGSALQANQTYSPSYYGSCNSNNYKYVCRNYNSTVKNTQFYQDYPWINGNQIGFGSKSASYNNLAFPHAPDNKFLYKDQVLLCEAGPVVRGRELGVAQCLHNDGSAIYEHGRVVTLNDVPYRMSVFNFGNTSADYTGLFMQPIVGPW